MYKYTVHWVTFYFAVLVLYKYIPVGDMSWSWCWRECKCQNGLWWLLDDHSQRPEPCSLHHPIHTQRFTPNKERCTVYTRWDKTLPYNREPAQSKGPSLTQWIPGLQMVAERITKTQKLLFARLPPPAIIARAWRRMRLISQYRAFKKAVDLQSSFRQKCKP